MKTVTLLLLAVIGLAGCVVVPGPPVVVGPPRAYVAPSPVIVVPAHPHHHRGYWGHRYAY